MTQNYFIIHGTFGTPFENWFPWLSKELNNKGLSNIVPQFPIQKELHNFRNWSKLLDYYLELGLINNNTTFICHSTGSIFITKYLIERKQSVHKLIFVSGVNNYIGGFPDFDKANESFFSKGINEIHNYCKEIICLYSDNDPYIPIKELEKFAKIVANKSVIVRNGGHINTESGYTSFQEIIPFIF